MAFDYQNVLSMLITRNQTIDFAGRTEQIKQLSAICCVETSVADYVDKHYEEVREFKNGMVQMPNHTIRIVDVKRMDGSNLRYRLVANTNIQILDFIAGKVKVDWWGVPSDENGLPPISLKQLNYCVARCEEIIMKEKWIGGQIQKSVYDKFEADAILAYNAAKRSNVSKGEMDAATWMMRNGLFYRSSAVLKKRTAGNSL